MGKQAQNSAPGELQSKVRRNLTSLSYVTSSGNALGYRAAISLFDSLSTAGYCSQVQQGYCKPSCGSRLLTRTKQCILLEVSTFSACLMIACTGLRAMCRSSLQCAAITGLPSVRFYSQCSLHNEQNCY